MYKDKKILAVIPARGGSKGIPSKNIFPILGRPLIEYTIDCASDSKYLDRIVISTDSKEIKEVSERYIRLYEKKVGIPFMRPKELASDRSKTIDCVVHAVDWLKENEKQEYDYVILLQNTSPLRKAFHIDEAIKKLLDSKETSLVSVTEVEQHPILMRSIDEKGIVKNLLNIESTVRRQDFPKYYKVNGAIYIQKIDNDFNLNTSLNDGKLAYIMDNKYSIDIESYLDIKIAEYYIEQKI